MPPTESALHRKALDLTGHVVVVHESAVIHHVFAELAEKWNQRYPNSQLLLPADTKAKLDELTNDPHYGRTVLRAKDVLRTLEQSDSTVVASDPRTARECIAREMRRRPVAFLSSNGSVRAEIDKEMCDLRERKRAHPVRMMELVESLGLVERPAFNKDVTRRTWSSWFRKLFEQPAVHRYDLRPASKKAGDRQVRDKRLEFLAEGGEALVYMVKNSTDHVVKIYKRRRGRQVEKLKRMVARRIAFPGLCWPTALVEDQDGRDCGFMMKRAAGLSLAQSALCPSYFAAPKSTWNRLNAVELCRSILAVVSHLHQHDILIGDISPNNILMKSPSEIYFVDCDSYQFGSFTCPVGTLAFTHPDLHGQRFADVSRTVQHEQFALAVLFFMILMSGKHPYAHIMGPEESSSGMAGHVRTGIFPYRVDGEPHDLQPRGPWGNCWSHLPGSIRKLLANTLDRRLGYAPEPLDRWDYTLRLFGDVLRRPGAAFRGPTPGYDLSPFPRLPRFKRVGNEVTRA